MAQLIGEELKHFLRTKWAPRCGKQVRERRMEMGLSLGHVGALAGVPKQTISAVELGNIIPTDHLKLSISGALGCDAIDLWPWPSRKRLAEVAGEFAA